MKIRFITLSLAFVCLLFCTNGFSEEYPAYKTLVYKTKEYRLGGAIVYNFKTKGFGLDLRAEFPLKKFDLLDGISIVPQITYYPPFNRISEFYLGSSVHLGLYTLKKWKFYTLANISYNGWINYKDSDSENAKFSKIGLDAGLGITRNTCIRPFMEFRLNFTGMEPTLRLGLLFTIHCQKYGAVPCSKIPPEPIIK